MECRAEPTPLQQSIRYPYDFDDNWNVGISIQDIYTKEDGGYVGHDGNTINDERITRVNQKA